MSKGQGNYEALSNEKLPIFFLLTVKCHVVANDIGAGVCKTGGLVIGGLGDIQFISLYRERA
ncbi:MAG: ARMT1-like domain-containing protein [Desulfobacteraceae bacterium]|nr:ARMT1-like domain-containing protein [Desulfobacteraceae bacterium]